MLQEEQCQNYHIPGHSSSPASRSSHSSQPTYSHRHLRAPAQRHPPLPARLFQILPTRFRLGTNRAGIEKGRCPHGSHP